MAGIKHRSLIVFNGHRYDKDQDAVWSVVCELLDKVQKNDTLALICPGKVWCVRSFEG